LPRKLLFVVTGFSPRITDTYAYIIFYV
jgi:hypothetical protein